MSKKKLDDVGLQQVWAAIISNFVAKQTGMGLSANDFTDEFVQKLNNIAAGAQVNVIESVSVNGVDVAVSNKGVNILVPTGTLAGLDEVAKSNLDASLQNLIDSKLSAADLETYYTKTEVDNAIRTAVSKLYKVKGSVAFASLPSQNVEEGDTYNVTDAFTTTADFIEGAGKKYPAGTNVTYTSDGKWDCMAGTYDFSDFMMKDDLVDLTEAEIAAICVLPE